MDEEQEYSKENLQGCVIGGLVTLLLLIAFVYALITKNPE